MAEVHRIALFTVVLAVMAVCNEIMCIEGRQLKPMQKQAQFKTFNINGEAEREMWMQRSQTVSPQNPPDHHEEVHGTVLDVSKRSSLPVPKSPTPNYRVSFSYKEYKNNFEAHATTSADNEGG
ncbi:Hypothetical predicted protein [Prunus dulcis]|uniref:Uncharacterized protein n=1 Tax=Prunus dulcis TaxID=3755 RepID=A0A5E4GJL9_PRUDU|nr:hypothetical protein L3X38_039059 [Prunus dulcis]VVA09530.1 Hypothetical predicted protein [Prunus dulcis]VVA39926.1 Hypothetical predicted protein [Prunus dulcis]